MRLCLRLGDDQETMDTPGYVVMLNPSHEENNTDSAPVAPPVSGDEIATGSV